MLAAAHELGHAVACIYFRIPFQGVRLGRIRVKRSRTAIGKFADGCLIPKDRDIRTSNPRRFRKNQIVMMFAGEAAVRQLWYHEGGGEQDEKDARKIATDHLGIAEGQLDSFLKPLRERARKFVRKSYIVDTIDLLTEPLVQRGELSDREIRSAYKLEKFWANAA